LDNYFKNLDMHPKDEFEDTILETPTALEIALINEHLLRFIKREDQSKCRITILKKDPER